VTRQRKFWGWGYEDEAPSQEEQQRLAALLAARLGVPPPTIRLPPTLDEITLRAPRVNLRNADAIGSIVEVN